MEFLLVTPNDKQKIEILSKIATSILREHYDPIIGKVQNDYMLKKFQSVPSITKQLQDGYIYYLFIEDNNPIGFMGLIRKENYLYISKLYLDKAFRGQGKSKLALKLIIQIAKDNGLNRLELNVNKHNTDSIKAYEHLGFKRIRAEENDIGHGFIMDDYVYEYNIF